MTLEALASNNLSNFITYDTISPSQLCYHDSLDTRFMFESPYLDDLSPMNFHENSDCSSATILQFLAESESVDRTPNTSTQGRKKKRKRGRACKNKEEVESQRMIHIAVERNRRKQMKEQLAILRSLMPESYILRGDQASIVGGAIDYVKELEHLHQSLEAQKLLLQQQRLKPHQSNKNKHSWDEISALHPTADDWMLENQTAVADIEVTMINSNASLRILSPKRLKQFLKIVAGFERLALTILRVKVTTLDQWVLYSIITKVEEGCNLTSVDDIAGAVRHMLTVMDEDAILN